MNNLLQLINDNRHIKQPFNLVQSQDEASLYIYDIIDADYGIGATQVTAAKPNKDLARSHIDALTLNRGKDFN